MAVNIALQVLSWFENLPEDEQPPRHIWWSEDLLSEWFKDVKKKRSTKSGGRRETSWDTGDDVPLVQNELTAGLRDE